MFHAPDFPPRRAQPLPPPDAPPPAASALVNRLSCLQEAARLLRQAQRLGCSAADLAAFRQSVIDERVALYRLADRLGLDMRLIAEGLTA